MKVDGSVAVISIKIFPIGLHVLYLYFLDTPRNKRCKLVGTHRMKPCGDCTGIALYLNLKTSMDGPITTGTCSCL